MVNMGNRNIQTANHVWARTRNSTIMVCETGCLVFPMSFVFLQAAAVSKTTTRICDSMTADCNCDYDCQGLAGVDCALVGTGAETATEHAVELTHGHAHCHTRASSTRASDSELRPCTAQRSYTDTTNTIIPPRDSDPQAQYSP